MKAIVTSIVVFLAFFSFGEESRTSSFSSIDACKQQAKDLISQFQAQTTKDLYSAFNISVEADPDMEFMLSWMDRLKLNAGKFKYIEEIGSTSLGTFSTKVGYIVKFESGTFFGEVRIGKISESEFKIVGFSFKGNKDARKLIDEIPDYYWK